MSDEDRARVVDRQLAALRADELTTVGDLAQALDVAQPLVHDQPETALLLAKLCAAAALRHDLPGVAAQAHYLIARVVAERGDLDLALQHIDTARELWLAAAEPLSALRTSLGRMQILDDRGRHRAAIAVGRTLLESLRSHEDSAERSLRDWLRATAWNNIGVAYSFLGEHQATIDAYAAAETAYEKLGMTAETAKTRANRGIELLEIGRAREALGALSEARAIFAAEGDRLWEAKCAGNIAQAHQQLGELVAALRDIAGSRAELAALGAHAESGRLQAIAARIYLVAGLRAEARGEAAAAAAFLTDAGMQHDAGSASLTAALACLAAGDTGAAQPWLAAAKQLFDEVGDRQYQAHVQVAEADLAARSGRRVDAARLVSAAAAELRDGNWLLPLAWALVRQADLSDDPGEVDRLLGAAEAVAEELPMPQLRYACALRRASRSRDVGDDAGAERFLREAVGIAERVGADLSRSELRMAFQAEHVAAHDALVDLLVRRGDANSVLAASRISSSAKARTLSDIIEGTLGERWRHDSDETDALIGQQRGDLSSTYHALQSAREPALYATLLRQAADQERDLTILQLEAATRSGPPPAQPSDGPAALDEPAPTVPTLSYHFSGGDLIAFVVVDGDVSARRIEGVRAEVERQLDHLADQWSRFSLSGSFTSRHQGSLLVTVRHTLHDLYRLVFAPVEDVIAPYLADELIVVPHRSLHRVPFHALHDGERSLIDRCAVTLAPTLGARRTPPHRLPDGELVVFAVPDEATGSMLDEARIVAGSWPRARTFVGEPANSAQLRATVPGPSVVHIACHGRYRTANPAFSALGFGDRWVTASEILELDLGGALVTLSACESGRPGTDSAEPVGLAWAFLAAGASGAIVSHWIVGDAVTTTLMSTLYAQLVNGTSPSQALRQAQLAIAAQQEHPYHWAPFSFVSSAASSSSGVTR